MFDKPQRFVKSRCGTSCASSGFVRCRKVSAYGGCKAHRHACAAKLIMPCHLLAVGYPIGPTGTSRGKELRGFCANRPCSCFRLTATFSEFITRLAVAVCPRAHIADESIQAEREDCWRILEPGRSRVWAGLSGGYPSADERKKSNEVICHTYRLPGTIGTVRAFRWPMTTTPRIIRK